MDKILLLKALADETRLKIAQYLLSGKKNASSIVEHIGKSQPNVSLALKQLYLVGIVGQEKSGREIFYSLNNPAKVKSLIEILEVIGK